VQATFAATLVDEWARAGLTDAVVCPGSRSTPMALALASTPNVRCHVRLDERSAGYFALGIALSSGTPVIVCTTSGTAAAGLHPAVLEAHHARVPLLVCTADRPPELHDVGAPQTVDQRGLFGAAVRWFSDPGVPSDVTARTWRPLAARAVAEARAGPLGPGPVHLNLAFRDPLVGTAGPLPAPRTDGLPYLQVAGGPDAPGPATAAVARWRGRRGVVVAGDGCGPPGSVLQLARGLGWPVLADPRSGCRLASGPVVAAADAVLRPAAVRRALLPEVIVLLGAPWASPAVGGFIAEAAHGGAAVLAVDPWWRWRDPAMVVNEVHRADPAAWLAAGCDALGTGAEAEGWLAGWAEAERAAQRAIDLVLATDESARGGTLSEPAVARRLLALLPPDAQVVAGSSMPVRDLEWFSPTLMAVPRVLANRGVNGIDGVCSTALGAAASGRGPVVALVGDLSFFHDLSALVRPAGAAGAAGCVLVVVDNGGGGIFSFLPQRTSVPDETFERLFGTPQGADVVAAASGLGLPVADVATAAEFDDAVSGMVAGPPLGVVRVRVPARQANVELHQRIHDAAAAAVSDALGLAGVPDEAARRPSQR